MKQKHCLALDLKDDPRLIAEYERLHQSVWPEVLRSIRQAGIQDMEIYRVGNRLFMIIEVDEGFRFEEKAAADLDNSNVQAWEELMWKYQQPLPVTTAGEKWIPMSIIFSLKDQLRSLAEGNHSES